MKSVVAFAVPAVFALAACSSSGTGGSGFVPGDDAGPLGGGTAAGEGGLDTADGGGTGIFGNDGGGRDAAVDGGVVITTTIYANTDDTLYTMDPSTKAITKVGLFAGMGGKAGVDDVVTDIAVDASGNVYANTKTVIYKATLPASGSGTVQLTSVAKIAAKPSQVFYALAFAPAGVLGPTEMLVGGDDAGELWSIDPASGVTQDLGSFGPVAGATGSVFELSGDIVFYEDSKGQPTGLATIRSCKSGTCAKTSDFLAGIDMAALGAAYASGTPAASLLKGIYGGSATSTGPGTSHGSLFGLGAWEGDVYAFARGSTGTGGTPAALVSIDPVSGVGSVLPVSVAVANGWSGAGVTTKVTITVPNPPPPPR